MADEVIIPEAQVREPIISAVPIRRQHGMLQKTLYIIEFSLLIG